MNDTDKNLTYWFLLGREPLLSAAELAAVLKIPAKDYKLAKPFLVGKLKNLPQNLIKRLGGTIKIGAEIENNLTEKNLIEKIIAELIKIEGKINFGISVYNGQNLVEKIGWEVKNKLKELNKTARFVFNNELTLSSVAVEKNGLTKKGKEFLILKNNGQYNLAYTLAVQPFAEWGARDYGRPRRDDVSGMLPPKLAMIMINLAISNLRFKIANLTILDPFCGSGTVLSEAALLGYKNLIGSDLSEKAVADTQNNFDWLKLKTPKLLQSDVADLANKLGARSVDIIATEPYMGPPLTGRETSDKIKKTCAELADLYIKAFTSFKIILKPQSTVVFLIPRFFIQGKWHTISDRIMPSLNKLGFVKNRLLPEEISPSYYLLYHRPGQFVGREVWRFTH